MNVSTYLTSQNLKQISAVGNYPKLNIHVYDKVYQLNRLASCFISPKICKMIDTEPCLDDIYIDIEDNVDAFRRIVELSNGNPLEFTIEERNTLLEFASYLENKELIELIIKDDESETITVNNAVSRLLTKIYKYNLSADEEIAFIAENISEISESELASLDCGLMDQILLSPSLTISNEDWLFEFIYQLNNPCLPPSRYVEPQFLSNFKIQNYIMSIDINEIDPYSWNKICKRLVLPVILPHKNSQQSKQTFNIYEQEPLSNGIISYLADRYDGNLSDLHIVDITASSVVTRDPCFQPKVVLDIPSKDVFHSKDQRNSWIMFDFKDKQVMPNYYTLKSFSNDTGGRHMKSWEFLGSNDGVDWTVLDERRDCEDLNGCYLAKAFPCQSKNKYRFLKILQTDVNHYGSQNLILCAIEFFGTLFFSEKDNVQD